MQQRSQIPEADESTMINALIKSLTPGPTASHLTRKKPKTVEELFMNWKNTSCLMMIIAKEWLTEMKPGRATEK
jgi:hypothetical protein